MEKIVIEVDEATAKKWQDVSPEIKGQLEKNIEKQIEILCRGVKEDEFFALLDKISDEAVKNGLTEEMLEKDTAAQNMLEVCLVKMPNQGVPEVDARGIVEFMRQNDGKK